MSEPEYRQDDDRGRGFCPDCGEPLSGLMVDGQGHCDQHGWVWANWNPPAYAWTRDRKLLDDRP